jgi:hypothetical protein
MGLGAAIALVSLMVFGGCPSDNGGTKENTEQIEVTGIPAQVGSKASYKIFVQLTDGPTADANRLAVGDAVIDGNSAIMDLYTPDSHLPWSGTGTIYFAIVISPQVVKTWEDIKAYGNVKNFSSKTMSFTWGSGLVPIDETQLRQLFNGEGLTNQPGIIVNDPDITYQP